MRTIADIPHPQCKISIFSMNQKWIIKIEKGSLEQTYKVSEMDVHTLDDVKKLLSESFMNSVIETFSGMQRSFHEALELH